jgi:hypothetical protein
MGEPIPSVQDGKDFGARPDLIILTNVARKFLLV